MENTVFYGIILTKSRRRRRLSLVSRVRGCGKGYGFMVTIKIMWDEAAEVWIAICEEIGLALESESYDTLVKRIHVAAPEMAQENNVPVSRFVIATANRQLAIA